LLWSALVIYVPKTEHSLGQTARVPRLFAADRAYSVGPMGEALVSEALMSEALMIKGE
jgi:hypothetical protein